MSLISIGSQKRSSYVWNSGMFVLLGCNKFSTKNSGIQQNQLERFSQYLVPILNKERENDLVKSLIW